MLEGVGSASQVLYVGTEDGLEGGIVTRAGLAFDSVCAAGLLGVSRRQRLHNVLDLLHGTLQAWRILRRFRPNVVLATGGYASAPVAVAAWLQRCAVMLYLPDIQPGLAVGALSWLAARVAVSFDASLSYFRGRRAKVIVSGYPVRAALYRQDKQGARERLGLLAGWKTLLVFGGSRGAQSINQAVDQALDRLLKLAQVIHITGEADLPRMAQRKEGLSRDQRSRYRPYGYLHDEMVDALHAADLAVARAGAATMGEFAAAGLPSILVPYPYAGRHQEANADFMVDRGAAVKVADGELATGAWVDHVEGLLNNEQTLQPMSQSARNLARPDAAQVIAAELVRLAGLQNALEAGGT